MLPQTRLVLKLSTLTVIIIYLGIFNPQDLHPGDCSVVSGTGLLQFTSAAEFVSGNRISALDCGSARIFLRVWGG